MTTVSFPITLTGDYKDGTVCKASDYRADFEKLRDAVNHMYERNSSFIFTGSDITYQDTANSYSPAWGDYNTTGTTGPFGVGSGGSNTDTGVSAKILNIIKIPTWMQGVRVRDIELCNYSRLPNRGGATWNGTTNAIVYTPKTTTDITGLTFGVGAVSDINHINIQLFTLAQSIKSIVLDTDAKVRGPFQTHASATINAAPTITNVVGSESNIDHVVAGGQYMFIYALGTVDFKEGGALVDCYDLNWHFVVNVICDAMVPVP